MSRLAILDEPYVPGLVSSALRPNERQALLYFLALYEREPESLKTAVEVAAEMGEPYSREYSNPLDSALARLVNIELVEDEYLPLGGGAHSVRYRLGPAAREELAADEAVANAPVASGSGPRSRLSPLAGRLGLAGG